MAQETAQYFRQEHVDGITIVQVLVPEILPESNAQLYAIADRLVDLPEPRRVVLDLARVRTIKSVGIGILVHFQKRVRDSKGALKLCNVDPDLARIFQVTKIDQLFEIHEDQQEAIDAFHGKARPKEGGKGSWIAWLLGR